MKIQILRAVALPAALLALSACSQAPQGDAPAAAAVDTETPEYAAMEYRQGLMHVIAFKAGQVRGMASGDIPVDEAVFVKAATDLAAATRMLNEAFVAGSDSVSIPGSNALPDIWSDWDAFQGRVRDVQTVTAAVASQAQSGGFQAAQATAADDIGPACGGCHRPYRQRDE